MIGQKLIKILQTLDPATFRRLGDAFASPYFTSSPLLLKLYALLKKEYPVFDSARLDKEKVFKALYPGKPFNDGALRVLVREFSKITEDFLIFESLKNDEAARHTALTKWYSEHNLYAEFEKSTHALLAKIEERPYRDVEFYKDTGDLLDAYFFHPHTVKYTQNDQALTRLMESVDKNYILYKLRLACEMKNRERILAKSYEIHLLAEAIAIGNAGMLQDNPAFNLYTQLLALYAPETHTETFQTIKGQLHVQMAQLCAFDQSLILTQLTNYAVRQLNTGNIVFNKDVFELYRLAIEYNLVLSSGKIGPGVYHNIVLAGCREKEFTWLAQFIEDYAVYLETDIRADCKTMALASLSFFQSDFDKTIELLASHHFFNLLMQMHTRIMLAKAWFEKFLQDEDCYDLLIYQVDAMDKYIRRNKVISGFKVEEHLNFLYVIKLLATLISNKKPGPEIRNRLEKYLNDRQRMVSRDWVEQKIVQYQNKR